MIHCFYKSDTLDGHCSGAIVKYRFPEAVMHPVTSKEQQLYDIDEEDGVHEFTSCAEVWRLLFPDKPLPLAVELIALYESGDYQGHKLEDMVLPFQMRMRMENWNPSGNEIMHIMACWYNLFTGSGILDHAKWEIVPMNECIEEGRLLLRYDEANKAKYAKTYAFETELETPCTCGFDSHFGDTGHSAHCEFASYHCIAVNLGHTNSKVFYSVWRRECPNCDGGRLLAPAPGCRVCLGSGRIEPYDLMITFCRRKDKLWNVSLYSTKPEIDCGAICKAFGGGGHKGAAGFQCKELPFII